MSAEIIFPQVPDTSLEDTSTWLHRLRILLPYVTAAVLELLPLSVPCPRYPAPVKGFNITYESFSPSNKTDACNSYVKTYLSQQSQSTGIACDIQRGTRNWIDINLGKFLQQSSTQDLIHFKAKFKVLS